MLMAKDLHWQKHSPAPQMLVDQQNAIFFESALTEVGLKVG